MNLIQRVLLGTLPQEVMSLPDNQVTLTNLFISSQLQRGYCYQIWAVKTTA